MQQTRHHKQVGGGSALMNPSVGSWRGIPGSQKTSGNVSPGPL